MATSNHERVGKAIALVRDGIGPDLARSWAPMYGEDWVEKINGLDQRPEPSPSADDLAFLLKGMWNTWNSVWRHLFGHAERSWVSELRDARNKWAHNEVFSTDDTYRVLDTSERLLQSFSAGEQLATIQTLKQDLLRQRYDQDARNEERRRAASPTRSEVEPGLTPWRHVVTPHPDVARGRFQQAEFAADLHQVANGLAHDEYKDPVQFFGRTFITEGLASLLTNAASRLSGRGGDPVVSLQTNFGGGKTHALIALYHLASGRSFAELPGVGELFLDKSVTVPAEVNRAVFVGHMTNAAKLHEKPDGTEVHTAWGEIAWQLGGAEGYELVREADEKAKNPGERLIDLFKAHGPAIVLIDEWVAYARQLPDGGKSDQPDLPAGDFDTHFTFAQALTDAAASTGNVLVVVSAPQSAEEVGGDRGGLALDRLEKVVFRNALRWQAATDNESFEIVRRRLFEPIEPDKARVRDAVVKAFSDYYRKNRADFPSEVGEGDYRRRMEATYPVHPELFERLFSDWSTLDRFQRTRGVLRLMAAVIWKLWIDEDGSAMIMPGTVPLDSQKVVSELTKFLEDAWDPVIQTDVDGRYSAPMRLDGETPKFGRCSAARKAARAVYMGSAPKEEGRGIDLRRVMLGCAQPGEFVGVFDDALRRLSSDATYLYVDGTLYWYSLQPSVARLARDRAESHFADADADDEVRIRLQADSRARAPFGAVHVFPDGPGDVPDESAYVRLIVLPLHRPHVLGDMTSDAIEAARAILDQRQGGSRLNRNMLVFLASDLNRAADLRRVARRYLAWESITRDQADLNLNEHQRKQAESRLAEAGEAVSHRIGEAYRFVLTPEQDPCPSDLRWEQMSASASGGLAERAAAKLRSEEKLITGYGGIRVRMDLDRVPLWDDSETVAVRKLWEYYAQYPYMPRLASHDVFTAAIDDGVSSLAWAEETFAYAEAFEVERGRFLGLKAGVRVDVGHSRTELLVKPERAKRQMEEAAAAERPDGEEGPAQPPVAGEAPESSVRPAAPVHTRFYGRAKLDRVRAVRDVESILQEVVTPLDSAEGAEVTITVEVRADADGFDDQVRRTVGENAGQLGFDAAAFEE